MKESERRSIYIVVCIENEKSKDVNGGSGNLVVVQ